MVKKVLLKKTPVGHKLSVNTDILTDVSRRYPQFMNWNKHGRIEAAGSGGAPRLTVSAVNYSGVDLINNGWADADFELIDPLPAGTTAYLLGIYAVGASLTNLQSLSGVNMKLIWDDGGGITSLTFGGDANNNVSVNLASRFATWTWTATAAAPQGGFATNNATIRFNFTSAGQPPTNIRMFEAADEAALAGGAIFTPTWLAGMDDYGVLRLMDFTHTNWSGVVNYSDIAGDGYCFWTKGSQAFPAGMKAGPPMSVLAALANQSGRPIWVCIPHQMTDAGITSYATYLRDNVTFSGSTVKVIFEYSNECWNSGFSDSGGGAGASGQYTYCRAQSAAMPGNPFSGSGTDWAGLRGAEVMSIVRNVFGTDSGNKWAGALGTQGASTSATNTYLNGMDYFLDPAHSLKRSGDTATTLFSYLAIAPYLGPTPSTTASGTGQTMEPWVDAADQAAFNALLYDELKTGAASSATWLNIAYWQTAWQAQMTIATGRGWSTVMYEGGNGSVAVNPLRDNLSGQTKGTAFNLALATFAGSAEAGLLHREMYNLYVADGGLLPNKYDAMGMHSKTGPWGARENFADTNACYVDIAAWNAA